jgi:hypothetical protein
MSEKITGYSLLSVGLAIMIFCVINVILVFTNQIKPFSYFNLQPPTTNANTAQATPLSLDSLKMENGSLNVNDLMSKLQGGGANSLPGMNFISGDSLNQILNLSTQFFLMTFILGFGYKIANLGVQLVRPINVKLKASPEIPPVIPPSQPQQPPLQ